MTKLLPILYALSLAISIINAALSLRHPEAVAWASASFGWICALIQTQMARSS